jgi:hypothetical protein
MKLNGAGHSKSDSNTPMPPPATTDEAAPPAPVLSDRPKSPVHTAEVGENRLQLYFPWLTIQYIIHKKKNRKCHRIR